MNGEILPGIVDAFTNALFFTAMLWVAVQIINR